MHSDRDAYLAKQIEILKRKERQQARKKYLWFTGGSLVIIAIVTALGYTLWSELPNSSTSDSSSSILVEEITQPVPATVGEEETTPVIEYGSVELLDSLDMAADSLAPGR